MRILIDSNVALRCVIDTDHQHELSYKYVKNLIITGHEPVFSAQVLAESWSVLTRPNENRGGFGLSPAKADQNIERILELGDLLPEPPYIWAKHREMLLTHSVSGVKVHDCRLAAWCILHDIASILTLNPDDFEPFGVKAIRPEKII